MEVIGEVKDVTISAVIIRADGTVEDRGVIASMDKGNVSVEPKSIKKIIVDAVKGLTKSGE